MTGDRLFLYSHKVVKSYISKVTLQFEKKNTEVSYSNMLSRKKGLPNLFCMCKVNQAIKFKLHAYF